MIVDKTEQEMAVIEYIATELFFELVTSTETAEPDDTTQTQEESTQTSVDQVVEADSADQTEVTDSGVEEAISDWYDDANEDFMSSFSFSSLF